MKQLIFIILFAVVVSASAQTKKPKKAFDSIVSIDAQTEKDLLEVEGRIKKSNEYRQTQIELEQSIINVLIRRKYNTDSVELKRYESGKLILRRKL